MKKREAGFLGLAKQNAKRKGMVKVPKQYNIKGQAHYPVFVTAKEMKELKLDGGSGRMTKYGIPAYPPTATHGPDATAENKAMATSPGTSVSGGLRPGYGGDGGGDQRPRTGRPAPPKPKKKEYSFSYDKSLDLMDNIKRIDVMGYLKSLGGTAPDDIRFEKDPAKIQQYLRDNPEVAKDAIKQQGGPDAVTASNSKEAEKTNAYAADRKEDYDKKVEREGKRQGFLDEYGDFQEEAKGLGKKSKDLTEGTMQDDSGRTPDHPDYVEAEGKMRGGFAGDVEKLGAYESKFDTLAGEAGTRGEKGEDYFQGAVDPVTGERVGGAASEYKGAGATGGADLKALGTGVLTDSEGRVEGDVGFVKEGATMQGGYKQITGKETSAATGVGSAKARELAGGVMTDASGKKFGEEGYDASTATKKGGYEQITGDKSVTQAGKGATDLRTGATSVGGVQTQFGKEGFQKDVGAYESQIAGMAKDALSGDVGQREAAMLKGRMEEGRRASQKGSEEKLRREMAQSGASPAEIAQKVAQFQRQSAAQQAQAGRSETLSSQLQGQQLGQAQVRQAAGLTGQALGALGQKTDVAGKQAGLAVTQAELRGKAAGMEMAGTEAQQRAKLASLAGQSQQNVTATGMDVQGTTAEQQAKLASLGGQGQMIQAGTGLEMEGVKGAGDMYGKGVKIGMAGADQESGMLTSGMGAVTAAGDARTKQMGGLDQQGGFIDQQGNYVQAQLASTESDITQASTEEQARLTRSAQGTPDDPRYRPPEPVEPATDPATTGTTTSPVNPATTGYVDPQKPVERARGGPVQGGRPYIVGEKGRELFTPSQSGNITPNSQMPPSPTEIKQTGDHSFTVAQGDASAPAPQGGINAAPPQAPAPPQLGNAAPPPPWLAEAQRKEFDRRNEELQAPRTAQQADIQAPMGQGGMMGGFGQGQPPQGNQQQGMMQQQQELNKQMGQAGQERKSWKDGGGLAGFGQGGYPIAINSMKHPGGIAQQGGLMGQNAPMNPEQQQAAEEMHKKRRQMQMESFGMR